MHYIAWDLLARLKKALHQVIGPEFLNAVPNEDQLPLVVGYIFSTAAGHGDSDVRVRGIGNDTFIDIATEVVNNFLDGDLGSWITRASQQEVKPEEVQDLDVLESLSALNLDSLGEMAPGPNRTSRASREAAQAEVNQLYNMYRNIRSFNQNMDGVIERALAAGIPYDDVGYYEDGDGEMVYATPDGRILT